MVCLQALYMIRPVRSVITAIGVHMSGKSFEYRFVRHCSSSPAGCNPVDETAQSELPDSGQTRLCVPLNFTF